MLKRSVVIKPRSIKPLNWDYKTIVAFTLFLCGVIIGAFIIKNSSQEYKDLICSWLSNYISTKGQGSFIMCFCGTALPLLVFVFVVFLLGLCATGVPLILLVPFLYGCTCGGYLSAMLLCFGIKGLIYCVLVDFLCYAITAATLFKCCCLSFNMAIDLFGCIMGNFKKMCPFNTYAIDYIVLCVPVLIGVLIHTICFTIFAELFFFI